MLYGQKAFPQTFPCHFLGNHNQYHKDKISPPIKAEPTARWWLQELLQTIEKDNCSGDSGITCVLLPPHLQHYRLAQKQY